MDESVKKTKIRISMIGRLITGISIFTGTAVMLMQRVNLNVVVPEIVSIHHNSTKLIYWTSNQQSLVLMSFYIGFFISQIISGFAVEKYGSKITMAITMVISSVSCILSPICVEKSLDALIFLRVMMGACQAIYFPVITVSITNWFQPNFRGTAVGLVFPGTLCGTILAMCITSALAYDQSLWPVTFYLFGGIGFLWLIFWMIFFTDDPQKNRWIKSNEKDFLKRKIERMQTTDIKNIPIAKIFTSRPFLAVMTSHFVSFWSLALVFTVIPYFMNDLYLIPIKDQTYISFLSPAFTWIGGSTSSMISDFILRKKLLSKLTTRKMLNSAVLPTGLFFMLATLIPPSKHVWGIVLIILASYFCGFQFSVIIPNMIDIAPQYCGILGSISNTLAALAGIISIQSTYMIVTQQHLARDWQISFGIMMVVQAIGFLTFTTFGKADKQNWTKTESTKL